MPLRERIGLDDFPPNQELWRFIPTYKAQDLFQTGQLYLTEVSALREKDPHESKLPRVLSDTFSRLPFSPQVKEFMAHFLEVCEDQATGVFASCWFLPGTPEQEDRMWRQYGGGSDGGLLLISSLDRLIAALPDDIMLSFGVGIIRYIRPDITYVEALQLNEYRSAPFLLKLHDHQDDREVRLYQRYRGRLQHPNCLRTKVSLNRLIRSIRLSPICSLKKREAIYSEFITKGLPKELFEYTET